MEYQAWFHPRTVADCLAPTGLWGLLTTQPRASLADLLCPGLLSFGLSALRNECAVQDCSDLLQIHHAEAEIEDAGRGAVGGGDLEDGLATVFAAQEVQHAGGGHRLDPSPYAIGAHLQRKVCS